MRNLLVALILIFPFVFLLSRTELGAQEPDPRLARIAALESRLVSLENELTLLEDNKAIRKLQRVYGYYLDQGLHAEAASLFTGDASVEVGGLGVYMGRERIAEFFKFLMGEGIQPGQLSEHIITQGVVHVDPDGEHANGRWRAILMLGRHGESATWSEGPYENEYRKENGTWMISKLHWYMTVNAPYAPGWHKAPVPMPEPLADLPPDAPRSENYRSYPGVYVPPFHYDNPVSGRQYGGAQ